MRCFSPRGEGTPPKWSEGLAFARRLGCVFKTQHTPSLRATPLQRGPQSTPTKIPSGEGCPQGGVWLGSRFPFQFSALVFCKHALELDAGAKVGGAVSCDGEFGTFGVFEPQRE